LFFRRSRFSGRKPILPETPVTGPDGRFLLPSTRDGGVNAPLSSLAGGSMASRFHAWHGASGRRYICSVFPVDPDAPDAGLPDFAEAIALAVAADADKGQKCIALFLYDGSTAARARNDFIASALKAGAVAWHIHLAEDPQQRLAVAKDIESGRIAEPASAR
jgi:hypothetical protein